MAPYLNRAGNSGVAAYDIGASHIDVEFSDGAIYRYTALSAGPANLNHMAKLARDGMGLNAFINRVVKKGYSARLR